jgi:hypothetical protein
MNSGRLGALNKLMVKRQRGKPEAGNGGAVAERARTLNYIGEAGPCPATPAWSTLPSVATWLGI